eukprot:Platyproteum_vivax@DN12404_c0_g1_i1.p1
MNFLLLSILANVVWSHRLRNTDRSANKVSERKNFACFLFEYLDQGQLRRSHISIENLPAFPYFTRDFDKNNKGFFKKLSLSMWRFLPDFEKANTMNSDLLAYAVVKQVLVPLQGTDAELLVKKKKKKKKKKKVLCVD